MKSPSFLKNKKRTEESVEKEKVSGEQLRIQ